jgi:outer membrane protein
MSMLLLTGWCAVFRAPAASAETLDSALAYTYVNNPQLGVQRAQLRAIDEGVPQALAGYRPKATATAGAGTQWLSTTTREISSTTVPGSPATYFIQTGHNTPQSYGVTLTQNVFNGYQTASRTRQAEAQVMAGRETLRATEQSVLLSAVTAYMNMLRDEAILGLQRRNQEVLEELLRQTRIRLQSGNVTTTDVSQAESRLSVARTQFYAAEATYEGSRATYRQIIGLEPRKLAPATAVDRFVPGNFADAVTKASTYHPAVTTAQFNVDTAALQVKVAESSLYPSVNLVGSVQRNQETTLTQPQSVSAAIGGQLSVPLYQGGAEYSLIRQAKETQGQKLNELAVAREQARAGVRLAWAQAEAAKKSLVSSLAQVKAAEAALNGVREEARLGQRTTYDVLNAQQELVNARIAVVNAERDRVVNSFAMLAAVGGLTVRSLGIRVPAYDAEVHYHQVRDAWAGVRAADGR